MELYQIKEERKCQCQIHVSQYLKKLTSRRTLFKSLKNQALTFEFFCAKSESVTSFGLFKLWRTIFSYSRIPCKITNWRSYKINAQASETLIDIWCISNIPCNTDDLGWSHRVVGICLYTGVHVISSF